MLVFVLQQVTTSLRLELINECEADKQNDEIRRRHRNPNCRGLLISTVENTLAAYIRPVE